MLKRQFTYRLLMILKRKSWKFISAAFAYTALLAYFIFLSQHCTFFEACYYTMQLFVLQWNDTTIHCPMFLQFLAPLISIITTIASYIVVLYEKYTEVLIRLLCYDHVVICGLGRTGAELAKHHTDRGTNVVIIEADANNPQLKVCKEYGAYLLIGNAASEAMLREAQVQRARCVYAMCGDNAANAEIAYQVRALVMKVRRRKHALACYTKITDIHLWNFFRVRTFEAVNEHYTIEFINLYEAAARELLNSDTFWNAISPTQDTPPQILQVGLGYLGRCLLVEMAYRWWKHERQRENSTPMHVTLIDLDAVGIVNVLRREYPALDSICELHPYNLDIRSALFYEHPALQQALQTTNATYISLGDDATTMSVAERLHHLNNRRVPITALITSASNLPRMLQDEAKKLTVTQPYWKTFSMLEKVGTPEKLVESTTIERLACGLYEDYRIKHSEDTPWHNCDDKTKALNRQPARHIYTKLQRVKCVFRLRTDWNKTLFTFSEYPYNEVDELAKYEHERWKREKEAQGWKYGPEMNSDRLEHPDIIEWEKLPELSKDNNRAIIRGLPGILAEVGFDIDRQPRPAVTANHE